jgi:hypothetical protein
MFIFRYSVHANNKLTVANSYFNRVLHKLIVANIKIFLASYGSPRATVNTVGIVGHDAFQARGSPDGLVTRLRVSEVRMSIPARGRDCATLQLPERFWGPARLLSNGKRG